MIRLYATQKRTINDIVHKYVNDESYFDDDDVNVTYVEY